MSEYKVQLDSFAGPLDLLLYLVRKEEVDIYDIPISHITEQYIQYLEMLKMLDIDLAGEFLVMAATLMEIKSIMLLPKPELDEQGDGDLQDPRAELVRQLLEYKKFKDAANLLQDAAEERQLRFSRPDTILEKVKPTEEPELDLDQVSIWTLLEAFDAILQATGHYQDFDHIKDDTPIDLYQIELLHRLQTEGPMSLQKAFEDRNNRLAMIGLFLGMLELMRNHLIWVEQPDATGPIYLKSLTTEPAEEAVHNAIYANPEAMEMASQEQDAADQILQEEVEVAEDEQGVDQIYDEDIDDDEFAKELSSIQVSSDEPEKPRIPILEIPSVEQKAEAEEPEQEAVNVEVPEKPRKPRIPIMELPPQKQPAPSPESVEESLQ
ncbi:MAG: segregation/condensation protein A [Phycisphaerae bacterium]|nr:segregation/condensation protein A [Phycisphaerae bacterium]